MALNLGFIINFILSFKKIGTTCTDSRVIPFGFYINFGLFVFCYQNIKMMQAKNWMIEWKSENKKEKDLFEAQTERLVKSFSMLTKLHAVEIVGGIILARGNISCINDGQNWAYKNAIGSIFFLIHIVGTMMGAGMIRAVFIKSPKATGYFMISGDEEGEDKVEPTETKKSQ